MCVNESNDLVIMDYFLRPLMTVPGIKGPPFSKSMSKSSLTGAEILKVNWFKGNHQAALIDLETGDEDERLRELEVVRPELPQEHLLLLVAGARQEGDDADREGHSGGAEHILAPPDQRRAIPDRAGGFEQRDVAREPHLGESAPSRWSTTGE